VLAPSLVSPGQRRLPTEVDNLCVVHFLAGNDFQEGRELERLGISCCRKGEILHIGDNGVLPSPSHAIRHGHCGELRQSDEIAFAERSRPHECANAMSSYFSKGEISESRREKLATVAHSSSRAGYIIIVVVVRATSDASVEDVTRMGTICGKIGDDEGDKRPAPEGREIGVSEGQERSAPYPDAARRADLYANVSLACRNAQRQMEGYGEKFAVAKFRTDLHSQHVLTMEARYAWLASEDDVPKNMGERLDKTYLDGLRAPAALAAADSLLVRVRMALETSAEQMMKAGEQDLAEYFLRSRDFVRAANVEVTSAMAELQVHVCSVIAARQYGESPPLCRYLQLSPRPRTSSRWLSGGPNRLR